MTDINKNQAIQLSIQRFILDWNPNEKLTIKDIYEHNKMDQDCVNYIIDHWNELKDQLKSRNDFVDLFDESTH